ncbi:MAG: septum formation initiator family protein [Bacteroidales bacterium]|nr:septum formation initiator family protein [Bacteroidales bacterium]
MKKFLAWCKRYISVMNILVIGFISYTLFFQDNSVFRYMEYQNTIDSLRTEIKNATDTMDYYRRMNQLLTTDPEMMERVVREQYNMVREDEDVYVYE